MPFFVFVICFDVSFQFPSLPCHDLHITIRMSKTEKKWCLSTVSHMRSAQNASVWGATRRGFSRVPRGRRCEENYLTMFLMWLFVCLAASCGKERARHRECGPQTQEVRHQGWVQHERVRGSARRHERLSAGKQTIHHKLFFLTHCMSYDGNLQTPMRGVICGSFNIFTDEWGHFHPHIQTQQSIWFMYLFFLVVLTLLNALFYSLILMHCGLQYWQRLRAN